MSGKRYKGDGGEGGNKKDGRWEEGGGRMRMGGRLRVSGAQRRVGTHFAPTYSVQTFSRMLPRLLA